MFKNLSLKENSINLKLGEEVFLRYAKILSSQYKKLQDCYWASYLKIVQKFKSS